MAVLSRQPFVQAIERYPALAAQLAAAYVQLNGNDAQQRLAPSPCSWRLGASFARWQPLLIRGLTPELVLMVGSCGRYIYVKHILPLSDYRLLCSLTPMNEQRP
ncbi:hypothetical protein [Carnimonas bestiolae]|uniref:hypothetical protein n=1 Tax=Carnimonas bestiolae TaxID=3402172 RepID=UPI003EDBB9E7